MLLEVGNVFVTLSESVVDIFCRFRQIDQVQSEAGGIVLGQVSTDEQRIFVNRASTPSRYDRRWPFRFQRNRHWAQQIVEYEYYNSGGRNTYLGEWHTHPAERAIPSFRDYKMIADQFAKNDIQIRWLLLFIIARSELFIGLQTETGLTAYTNREFSCQ